MLELEAGGKPSTWFRPGELVELSGDKEKIRVYFLYLIIFSLSVQVVVIFFLIFEDCASIT